MKTIARCFLGRITLENALARQEYAISLRSDCILGFESDPVITLGVRSTPEDLQICDQIRNQGYHLLNVDRGGQATLHNPGQLVIFPVMHLPEGLGVRSWVEILAKATIQMATSLGHVLRWNESSPGLYNLSGQKVVSMGIRVKKGISTHGLAINLNNDLTPFSWIRACGQQNAPVAHLGSDASLQEVFELWTACLHTEVDKKLNLEEFSASTPISGTCAPSSVG